MAVYVDVLAVGNAIDAQAKRVGGRNNHRWCHLIATTSDELRSFATCLGMRPQWIQYEGTEREHFDLTPRRRKIAVAMGAKEISARDMINIIRAKRAARAMPQPAKPAAGPSAVADKEG